ncbi:MAG TPA: 4a-hydroxytetrahydrobiopterin dehydratase [Aquificaceae bacterium]|nr:4a-hydroxytetrahydrobiopterin dehydratase [Aquificaceae bacterium]HIQ49376.1 4a-hydroxytetrahydrobiopterin dehydratase [Aquifex aeolicus]
MKVLSEGEIQERLKDLEGWNYEGNFIVKEINTKNWKTTIFLVNAIAGLAEARWHHPDMEVSFKKLKVKLTTHEAGGITEKDINLAKEIDELVREILKH